MHSWLEVSVYASHVYLSDQQLRSHMLKVQIHLVPLVVLTQLLFITRFYANTPGDSDIVLREHTSEENRQACI